MIEQRDFDFSTSYPITAGSFLISAANMLDPNFYRTVIFICETNEQGTFGLILNKKLSVLDLNSTIDEFFADKISLFQGGPVQVDSLHFLHKNSDVPGCREVVPGIYWGGDFKEVCRMIRDLELDEKDIRFFVGYAGWDSGQIEIELEQKSWYVAPPSVEHLFSSSETTLWKDSLKILGSGFEILQNYPSDLTQN